MTKREWPLVCSSCGARTKRWLWDYELVDAVCFHCDALMDVYHEPRGEAPGIATDSIPGGILIRHGLVNPDGSPRKFYSKTEIKQAANEAGWTISGDTPEKYRVRWSGKEKKKPFDVNKKDPEY